MNTKADFRLGRIFMLFLVTGGTAFGLSGDPVKTLIAAAAGLAIALSGFYLDHLLDAPRDKRVKSANPLARGLVGFPAAIILIIGGAFASLALAFVFEPLAAVPLVLILMVVLILGIRRLCTPFVRAAGLGLLQALYVLLGGIFAGADWPPVLFLAGFLFFAMTGGRVLGDVRDLPIDQKTGADTIPRRYGLVFARIFLCVNEAIAYAVGIIAFFTCGFSIFYLCAMLATAGAGTVMNIYFCVRPTPERARRANGLSLGVLGMLYVAAMFSEGIVRIAAR